MIRATALCRRRHNHGLRHTHATIALRAGVPLKVISERLDHESPASRSSSTPTSSQGCRQKQREPSPTSFIALDGRIASE